MFTVFNHILDATACSYYRAVLPARHLTALLAEEGVNLVTDSVLAVDSGYDAYMFHRVPTMEFLPVLIDLAARGKILIWDLDDNMFEIPESNPNYAMMTTAVRGALNIVLRMARHVTVSTEVLKNQLPFGEKTTILPNLIDPEDWWGERELTAGLGSRRRVLWAGSNTHLADLSIIADPILEISQYRDAEFFFYGQLPEEFENADSRKIRFTGSTPLSHYPGMMDLIRPDIGLAPLADNPFNRAKSNIKWLEYTMGGAVTIASQLPPYQDISETSIIKVSNDDFWMFSINETLRKSSEELERIRRLARHEVLTRHSWTSRASFLWFDFFKNLAG